MTTKKIFLIRHGETEWSCLGKHTGKTDISLTEEGKKQCRYLATSLQNLTLEQAFISPLKRAQETFALLNLSVSFALDQNLAEWDYGDYEGMTSKEIQKINPEWNIFEKGAPQGESLSQIKERADRVINRVQTINGDILLVSSAHILRSIAARWLRLPIEFGKYLMLSPASISILSYEHQTPSLLSWNQKPFS